LWCLVSKPCQINCYISKPLNWAFNNAASQTKIKFDSQKSNRKILLKRKVKNGPIPKKVGKNIIDANLENNTNSIKSIT